MARTLFLLDYRSFFSYLRVLIELVYIVRSIVCLFAFRKAQRTIEGLCTLLIPYMFFRFLGLRIYTAHLNRQTQPIYKQSYYQNSLLLILFNHYTYVKLYQSFIYLISQIMDKKVLVTLAFIAIVTFNLLDTLPKNQGQIHNLISAQKAQAFTLFETWALRHAKNYREDDQKSYRFGKFFQNFIFVRDHNKRYQQGLETFQVQLNKFADLDRFQFKSLFNGYKKRDPKSTITKQCNGKVQILDKLPESVDWVAKGAVSGVKNQGSCGSCWAFSACGALEGLSQLTKSGLKNFSPQQMVDCSTKAEYGNEGCNGGQMNAAMWYVIDHGITTLQKYPYVAKNQKCNYKDTMKVFQNTGCAEVPANKTIALASAVAKQPVAIAVEADTLQFQFYKKGVFSGKCGIDLDHGILLTGYGTLDGKDYWKCKNSWGNDWGMDGYILILKTNEDGPGQCGIMMENTVPLQ